MKRTTYDIGENYPDMMDETQPYDEEDTVNTDTDSDLDESTDSNESNTSKGRQKRVRKAPPVFTYSLEEV